MGFQYAIVGSGRQGISSAYDFILNGAADKIILIDGNKESLEKAESSLIRMTGFNSIEAIHLDIEDSKALGRILEPVDSMISGVPYYHNLNLTELAIESGTNMFDFGGNTEVVNRQLDLNKKAAEAGITIVPDCGMDPGLNISMIMYIVGLFDSLTEIKSYGAGLPQRPLPPWNYSLTFHINGLTNEYYGSAYFLRQGDIVEVPCFEGREFLDFPAPIGRLEAAVTSGGLSTLPWTLKGKVPTLENKTLRYPGHWERFKGYSELGLFELDPVSIGGSDIVPRELYHKLLEPKITSEFVEDLGIIKIISKGILNGEEKTLELELIDRYDPATGLTAMQRLTGWHASILAIYGAQGKLDPGVKSVQDALDGRFIIDEFLSRGVAINERIY